MESWRTVWREGLAPLLSRSALLALRRALDLDDPRLLQGATTMPPPLASITNWPCEGACAIGYMGWRGEGLETVGEVEEFFSRMCAEIDDRIGELAASKYFVQFWDETPRNKARRLLMDEVKLALECNGVPEYDQGRIHG